MLLVTRGPLQPAQRGKSGAARQRQVACIAVAREPELSVKININKYRFGGGKALSRLAQTLIDLDDAPARQTDGRRDHSPPHDFNTSPKLEARQSLTRIIRKARLPTISRQWSNRFK